MAAIQFKKAVKYDSRGRVAFIGPAGSGKSFSMLIMARTLVGPTGRIACVDTEHGSLSKYADLFDFDVIELESFSPDNFMDALKAAEDGKYDAFACDSLSHFWMGVDGALEFVDKAKRRSTSRDEMSGWKDFSSVERRMIDAMIASPCHVLVTMRTKTEYQEEEFTNARGERKKKRVKIGLAPVQRAGLEYEFDLVGYMDEDNNLVVDKTRCPDYVGAAIRKPSEKDFAKFAEWLRGAKRDVLPVNGTAYAANAVGQQKIDAMKNGATAAQASAAVSRDVPPDPSPTTLQQDLLDGASKPPKKADKPYDHFAFLKEVKKIKDRFLALGLESEYRVVLAKYGVEKSNQLPGNDNGKIPKAFYSEAKLRVADLEVKHKPAAPVKEESIGPSV